MGKSNPSRCRCNANTTPTPAARATFLTNVRRNGSWKALTPESSRWCSHHRLVRRLDGPAPTYLTQVMLIMSSDVIEFIPQRAHAVYTVHKLEVAARLILHARIIDDCVANGLVHAPGDIQRHARIVESLSPRVLIHYP